MEPADTGFDPDFPLPVETEAAADSRLGVAALFVDTMRRPRRAMERLAAHPDRRWLLPLLLLVAVAVAGAAVELPAARAAQDRAMQAQLEDPPPGLAEGAATEEAVEMATSGEFFAVIAAFAIVGAVVGTALAVFVVAAIAHLLGTVVGGQQSYAQVLSTTAWARLPLAVGGLVWIVWVASGHWDPNPSGLSGLVASSDPVPGEARSYLYPVLAQIELWNLWYLALLGLAVQAASRVSLKKALVVVAIVVALEIALGLVGVALSNAMSGFFG